MTTKKDEGKCEGELSGGCLYHGTTENDGKGNCLVCEPGKMLSTPKGGGTVTCEATPDGYNCGQATKTWDTKTNDWKIGCISCKNGDKIQTDGKCKSGGGTKIDKCEYVFEFLVTMCIKCEGSMIPAEAGKPCPDASGECITIQGKCWCNTEKGYYAIDVDDTKGYTCKKGSRILKTLSLPGLLLVLLVLFLRN